MRHLLISCFVLILALVPGFAQEAPEAREADPIRDELTKAVQDYRTDSANAKAVVTGVFDARFKATAATGNLDAVKKLVAEKQAYEAAGTLPAWSASVPALKNLPKSLAEVDARLAAAYKKAEVAYTKVLQLDKAVAVRDELKTHLARAAAAPEIPKPGVTANPPAGAPERNVARASIDLMPFIDVDKDSVNGRWSQIQNGLRSDRGFGSGVRIRYEPPEEYDFLVEFTRTDGNDCIAQFCWGYGHRFRWVIGSWNNTMGGIDDIGHRQHNNNSTAVKISLENGKRYKSVVKVRKNKISCYLDDRLVTSLETDYSDLAYDRDGWRIEPGILGVATWTSSYTIHKLSVTEITGTGKKPPAPLTPRRPSPF